jgi:O-antigen/teichoic acid export membrane protein
MTQRRSLRIRSRDAASWSVVQIVVSSAMRLGSNLILTRLLAPEAFGLIGLAMTVVMALTLLSDIGIGRSIVREPDGDTTPFLQAAWRAKVLRGSVIAVGVLIAAALLWLLGPWLAPADSAYADPALPGLIAVTAFGALTQGLGSTCAELAARRMQTGRIVLVQLLGQSVTILATLTAAWLIGSVWAIAIGMTIGSAFALLLTFTMFPGPRMVWNADPVLAARLWSFGRWIILSSSLTFLQTNGDKLALAALLGPTAFGHYVIGLIWLEAGKMLYSTMMGRIAYPAFSEVALSRPADLPGLYRRLQRLGDAYLLAAFLILHFGASTLIGLLYTDAYADSGHFLGLAAFALLASRFDLSSELLISLGDSRAIAFASTIRTVSLGLALPLGWYLGGVDGLILGSMLHSLAQTPFMLWKLKRHLPALNLSEDIAIVIAILTMVVVLPQI